MNKKYIVRLTADEREHLKGPVGKGKAAAYKIKHANILLMADADGPAWTDERIAEAFSVHSKTVGNVRERLVTQGLEAALNRKKREKPPREKILDGAKEARLIALACSKPPLALLTAIVLLGMSTSANAEEMKIVDDGKLVKENVDLKRLDIKYRKTADGRTWKGTRNITREVRPANWTWYTTGPGGAIQLTRGKYTGRIVVPGNHLVGRTFRAHLIYSDDKGETWKLGAVSPSGLNESQAVELSNGDVMLNSRNHGVRSYNRGVCVSHDGGQTFDEKLFRRDETLVEPRCQASIRRYSWPKDGKPGLILFSNPASTQGRFQMTIRGSYDDGKTWPWSKLIYAGGAAYSDLAVLRDGRIILLFEKDGKYKLEFVMIPAPPARPQVKAGK